jgi:hypothetical protein
VPDGTPHFRRNVHGGIVVVVEVDVVVVVEVDVVGHPAGHVVEVVLVVVVDVVERVVVVVELVVVVVVLLVVVVVPKVVVVVVVVVVVLLVGVVVEVVLVVVELLVVVGVGPHAGSAGSVQEQSGFVLQFVTTDFLHVLRSMPDKPAHAALISSAQVLFVHFPAALASETKTPAASATAANATTALLVIVEPPYMARSRARHRSRRTTAASHVFSPLVKGVS